MTEIITSFETLLNEEDSLLDSILQNQKELHDSITNKDWTKLTSVTAKINLLSDEFQKMEIERESLQSNLSKEQLHSFFDKLSGMRSKLLKSKIENQALSQYLNITTGFVQGVIDKVSTSNSVYSKDGFVQQQVQGVVLNQLL
jgi:hypothetical protein